MRRGARLVREALLSLAALLGLLCLVGVVASVLFGVGFVVFRTGSMEPGYPVGALSVTVRVPADQVKPGDVVSVKRPGSGTLVTHRAVSVRPEAGGPAGAAALILKGDANTTEDPLPYQVDTVQRVVFTVPAVGTWVMNSRGPWFLGAATLVIAAVVTWAFWPHRTPRHAAGREA
ncbi:signal peptidase I [Arthrobacter horti]|uniref:signal peptidase I n=1 Tax=Arthrobacter horti TaxID=3068273 RepID=UPI00273E481E|nr:signal peptidase I [Arthrobacter sp. YJM1]